MKNWKTILSLLLAVVMVSCGGGEDRTPAPDVITFSKTFSVPGGDNEAYSVQQTNDGGYIIAGTNDHNYSDASRAYVIKLQADGTLEWEQTYGSPDSAMARSIRQTADGGYIIAGEKFSNQPGSSYRLIYLIKIDDKGFVVWEKIYNDTKGWSGRAYAVEQTVDGGYILAGELDNPDIYWPEVYVIKTDQDGLVEWEKGYEMSSNNIDTGHSIQQTADGGYIIAGSSRSFIKAPPYNEDFLIKLDSSGALEWQKTYGSGIDQAYSARQTADGGYILTGSTTENFGISRDVLLVKTDAEGAVEWEKIYGGEKGDEGYAVRQTVDGGYVIAGHSSSFGTMSHDPYLIKTDSTGIVEWEKTYDSQHFGWANDVRHTKDGGYILAGFMKRSPDEDGEIYLIKTDGEGNVK